MAKKPKHVVRTYDDPDIGIQNKDGSTIKIFVLAEFESLPRFTSTKYDHHFHGPGVIYETVGPSGRWWEEHYVNKKSIWEYVSRLIRDGLAKGSKVISKTDQPPKKKASKPKPAAPAA